MKTVDDILHALSAIRREMGMERGEPTITRVVEEPGRLHIIVDGRSDKSLCLGPGGRVAAELAKRLNMVVSVHSEDELLLRRRRLDRTLVRVALLREQGDRTQRAFLDTLVRAIEAERGYPESDWRAVKTCATDETSVALAFSGGVDSTASLALLRGWGIRVTAVFVNLGHGVLEQTLTRRANETARHLGAEWVEIHVDEMYHEIVQRALVGRIHPCGQCHGQILHNVRMWASQTRESVLVTGELLPTGTHAVSLQEGMLVVHLPAALALSKHRTRAIAEPIHGVFKTSFGCLLLREVHRQGWRMIAPSVFRVLRELEAGALSTGMALRMIRDIVRPTLRSGGEEE